VSDPDGRELPRFKRHDDKTIANCKVSVIDLPRHSVGVAGVVLDQA